MKTVGMFAGLIGVCIFGTILFAIATVIVLALIPLYLKTNTPSTIVYPREKFSMSYGVPEGYLPEGKVADNHITRLHEQLSTMTNREVSVSNLSATIIQAKNLDKPIARRQAGVSLILQLDGFIQGQGGCMKQCLMKNLNSFKQSLCSMRPSLYV